MSGISTHILDTSRGRPAATVGVVLERKNGGTWTSAARAHTDADGRARFGQDLETGTYRLTFDIGPYFGDDAFFPEVTVTFEVREAGQNYHVPLLISPYGYSTYRGS